MKWGIRRYQNHDGTLTEAGQRKYENSDGSLNAKGRRAMVKFNGNLTKAGRLRYNTVGGEGRLRRDAFAKMQRDKGFHARQVARETIGGAVLAGMTVKMLNDKGVLDKGKAYVESIFS